MSRIVTFLVSTVDGFYAGPDEEFDWPVVDAEFNEFAVAQLKEADALMFGRVTYSYMAQYWPTPQAQQDDPAVAKLMNDTPKIVVTRTLETAEWAPTTIVRDLAELAEIKTRPGRDIIVMGSPDLTVSLMNAGLLDELRVMVHPVVLGAGRSLLRTADRRYQVKLLSSRPFASGSVLNTYAPQGSSASS
jgi:dihydrofolate reductase